MHSSIKALCALCTAALASVLLLSIVALADDTAPASVLEEGKAIAFDRQKGNCLSCHLIVDGELAGNTGPPLISMEARFPDKEKLRAQIYDATAANPDTMMPPFGRHHILSEEEIDKVTEYIYSL